MSRYPLYYNLNINMAINVNTVYQTVLSILNKEQRGYLTPDEFNKTATQVQLEIFEKYFEDLNQQLRVPQADVDYSDRVMNLDEKIAIFKTFGDAVYVAATPTTPAYFTLPQTSKFGVNVDFYRIGTVTFTNSRNNQLELQRLGRTDFYNIERSPLTKATEAFPTYLLESPGNPNIINQPMNINIPNVLFVNPLTIQSNIQIDFIRKPLNVIWGFTTGTRGQYIWNENFFDAATGLGSINFELHESEQTNVILRILAYAGIIIEDPTIVNLAAQQVQGKEVNKRS